MNNKKEYNEKYQTGKEDGFIILDKKEVPVDKLFKTYEKALKYIQKHGELMGITDSTPLPVLVHEISEDEFWSRRHNRLYCCYVLCISWMWRRDMVQEV